MEEPLGARRLAAFCETWLSRLTPVDPLFTTLICLSQQWQNIDFEIGADSASRIFSAERRFPLLEKLDISISRHNVSVTSSEAPQLREVTIHPHNPHIQLPWHQLTLLCCYDVHSSLCVEILRNCPKLLDGTFSFARTDSSGLSSHDILKHNHLQRLDLSSTENSRTPLLVLDCLKIPGLTSLQLESPNLNPAILPADVSPLLSSISRSCELHSESLTQLGLRTTPDDVVECLKATSSLVCLRLSLSPYVPMDALSARSTGQLVSSPNWNPSTYFRPELRFTP
ncbi:hypothetical protein C8R47DRAFT_457019 [Mycena vitilis]|nr:hypothetical protein C8R47DRAFT_457019 [Mycena vitilis]